MRIDITDAQVRDIIGRIDAAERKIGYSLGDFCYMEVYDEETHEECMEELSDAVEADWYAVGMSKVVFFFKDYPDLVVKLPLRGCVVYKCDDDGEYDDGETFYYSHAVVGNEHTWDYCAAEEYVYSRAERSGVEEMFAQTMRIGETESGYPVYVSRYIGTNSSRATKLKRDRAFYYIESNNVNTWVFGKYMVADMMATYPVSLVLSVIDFMRRNGIGDMHPDNYRFDDEGNLVFVDYSDFNDHTEDF